MDATKDLGFGLSKCCRASFRATLTDNGEWRLYCVECEELCAFQEGYSIGKFDTFVP